MLRPMRSGAAATTVAAAGWTRRHPVRWRGFGRARRRPVLRDKIEDHADYDGADSCSPTDKPGAVTLKDLVLATYPGTTAHIGRACGSGSSEHYEGRAIDWMVSAETQRPMAEDLFRWLLADDAYGNDNAMVRRLGVMYIIFDRQVWRAYDPDDGWQSYDGSNPHTDHVHISMSWDGALRETRPGSPVSTSGPGWTRPGSLRPGVRPHRLDVFRRGLSGELQQRTWADTWGAWDDLGGGKLSSGPAALWSATCCGCSREARTATCSQRRWT